MSLPNLNFLGLAALAACCCGPGGGGSSSSKGYSPAFNFTVPGREVPQGLGGSLAVGAQVVLGASVKVDSVGAGCTRSLSQTCLETVTTPADIVDLTSSDPAVASLTRLDAQHFQVVGLREGETQVHASLSVAQGQPVDGSVTLQVRTVARYEVLPRWAVLPQSFDLSGVLPVDCVLDLAASNGLALVYRMSDSDGRPVVGPISPLVEVTPPGAFGAPTSVTVDSFLLPQTAQAAPGPVTVHSTAGGGTVSFTLGHLSDVSGLRAVLVDEVERRLDSPAGRGQLQFRGDPNNPTTFHLELQALAGARPFLGDWAALEPTLTHAVVSLTPSVCSVGEYLPRDRLYVVRALQVGTCQLQAALQGQPTTFVVQLSP